MSIYVSICCLGRDTELIHTIRSAKDNASSSDKIHMGIVCIGDENFYNEIVSLTSGYSNLKIEYYDSSKEHLGVGFGRHASASLYEDQDYFLQIDAHTFFMQDWDLSLEEKFSSALKRTKNNKTVLSGFPGRYGYIDDEGNDVFWIDDRHRYPYYIKGVHYINIPNGNEYINLVPGWNDGHEVELKEKFFKKLEKNKAMPLTKISAAFIFGNREFAKNINLPKDAIFWDEEIIQTINLIGDGFCLAYVGPTIPIMHLYSSDVMDERGSRDNIDKFWIEEFGQDGRLTITKSNYFRFYKDKRNAKKIKTYDKYIGFNSMLGPTSNRIKYPNRFINAKRFRDYFPQPQGRGGWF